MKVEVKNVKYSELASDETNCFKASVYIDGELLAHANNEGCGGNTNIRPIDALDYDDIKRVDDHIKENYPKLDGLTQNLEFVVDLLVEDYLDELMVKKESKKFINKMKKMTLCYDTIKGKVSQFKIPYSAEVKKHINSEYPQFDIMNEMTNEEVAELVAILYR